VHPLRAKHTAVVRSSYSYLGPFDSPIEAAHARDQKTIELHAEFARLNFPEE